MNDLRVIENIRNEKQRFQKIIQAVGSFLAPLYDKIMVYLEPYLATYQKKRRDKKKE